MSPEYAMEGFFSFKSDVYSFGVMVLEIVSGKRNQGYFIHSEHEMNLLGHVSMGETTNFLKEKKTNRFLHPSYQQIDICNFRHGNFGMKEGAWN